MRVKQPSGSKGSLKWMQLAVEQRWGDLEAAILRPLGATTIDWLSPVSKDDFAEYRDATFLARIGHAELAPALAEFWPNRGPQWDGLARTEKGQIVLVEAKAHIGEFYSPPSQAGAESLAKIHRALDQTSHALGVDTSYRQDWHRHFYQYANRLAHLYWLRRNGVDASLVLIGFVDDHEMPGKTTPEAWKAAYHLADRVLGLKSKHALSRHIVHVYPSVIGRAAISRRA